MKRSTRSPAGFQIWDGAGWTGWGKGGSGEGNSREPGKPDDTTHYPFSRKRTTAIPKRYLTSPLKFTKKSCFIFSTYLVKRQFSKCSPPKCQFWFWLFSLCLFSALLTWLFSSGSSSLCLCHGCDQMFGSENDKNITSHGGVPSDANETFTVV